MQVPWALLDMEGVKIWRIATEAAVCKSGKGVSREPLSYILKQLLQVWLLLSISLVYSTALSLCQCNNDSEVSVQIPNLNFLHSSGKQCNGHLYRVEFLLHRPAVSSSISLLVCRLCSLWQGSKKYTGVQMSFPAGI
jgi:hypothetical protein